MADLRQGTKMTTAIDRLYLDPTKHCDLVMKGGITSGIVYPPAIAELAKEFRFHNIGGTSAGAIAAAAAAAAEVGRETGGFTALAGLPDRLARSAAGRSSTVLRSLFQPQPSTRAAFETLTAPLFTRGNGLAKVWATLSAALRHHPLAAIVGALPGLAAAGVALASAGWLPAAVGLVAGLVLAGIGIGAAVAFRIISTLLESLPANGFGLCLGSIVGDRGPGLAEFLTDELQRLAGREPGGPLLTFGDLVGREIELRMLATDVTLRAPVVLPRDLAGYWYDPAELGRYFPPHVMRHLEQAAPSSPVPSPGPRLRRMPATVDLPVIVAVRLSLSFPLLLSAVPLWSRPQGDGDPARNWISDGGITSNFPIHFFDRPLPSRPTFAISLARREEEEMSPEAEENVVLPEPCSVSSRGRREFGNLGGFLAAIADATQNWADTEQARIPGYQDRIVVISHTGKEGGLNLDMERDVIQAMTERGAIAGHKLRRDFDFANHRWTRYRIVMDLLETWLDHYRSGYTAPPGGYPAPTYGEMIEGPPPYCYRGDWTGRKEDFARIRTDQVRDLAASWSSGELGFGDESLAHQATLRVTPHT